MFVPVVDKNNRPLMPTTSARARRWIKSKKATPFFEKGVFCVRLNVEPSNRNYQPVALGVDPGSKREGFTVKSKAHTYLNVQTHAVDWVKEHVLTRRNMRRTRRNRKTPCRQNRSNRLANKQRLAPSTKARWQWKLRVCKWLSAMFPVTVFVVEDIKARTWKNGEQRSTRVPRLEATALALAVARDERHPKGKKWNHMFSPLEVGKQWFYGELKQIAPIETKSGNDTYELRQSLGLKKSKNKLSNKFDAHCVDSWVLANWYTNGHSSPDNTKLIEIIPLRFHRRQLHRLEHARGHVRSRYGGTISVGFKRGSIVKHPKYGFTYVSGWHSSPTKKDPSRKTISLYSLKTGKRLTQNAIPTDCKFLSYSSWRVAS